MIKKNHVEKDHVSRHYVTWNFTNTEDYVNRWYVIGNITIEDHSKGYHMINIIVIQQ